MSNFAQKTTKKSAKSKVIKDDIYDKELKLARMNVRKVKLEAELKRLKKGGISPTPIPSDDTQLPMTKRAPPPRKRNLPVKPNAPPAQYDDEDEYIDVY